MVLCKKNKIGLAGGEGKAMNTLEFTNLEMIFWNLKKKKKKKKIRGKCGSLLVRAVWAPNGEVASLTPPAGVLRVVSCSKVH